MTEQYDRYFRSCRLDSIRIRPLKWISRSEHDQVREISVGPGSGNRIDPTDCQPCFRGRRYGHLTSNIAESLNAKLLPAREMPILASLESIRLTLIDCFSQKRQLEANTPGIIVRKVATQIQDAKNHQARRYRFKHCIGMEYEVKSNQTLCDYLVNIEQQTCSCRQ